MTAGPNEPVRSKASATSGNLCADEESLLLMDNRSLRAVRLVARSLSVSVGRVIVAIEVDQGESIET